MIIKPPGSFEILMLLKNFGGVYEGLKKVPFQLKISGYMENCFQGT